MNEYEYIENLIFDFFMHEAVNEVINTKDQAKEIKYKIFYIFVFVHTISF